jgi:SiaC family regulatory phosphoprotein
MTNVMNYRTEPTKRTPRVILEPGKISVLGRSIPVNTGDFYRPVLEWIRNYVKGPEEDTCIEFGFEYINTSSTKWIYNIIKEISAMKGLTKRAKITWYYEHGDEDMCELGFILRSFVDCPFRVVEVRGMIRSPYDELIPNPA